jgi:hypothetical protein
MQTAAIAGQRSAGRDGDNGAERRDAILSRHPKRQSPAWHRREGVEVCRVQHLL